MVLRSELEARVEVVKQGIYRKDTRISDLIVAGANQAQIAKVYPSATVGIFINGFDAWEIGKAYTQYSLFSYDGKVGFCRQSVTAMEHQPPFSTGMEAIYGVRPSPDEDGIYPYVYNMAATVGMRVRSKKDNNVYTCIQDIDPMLYDPADIPAHFSM